MADNELVSLHRAASEGFARYVSLWVDNTSVASTRNAQGSTFHVESQPFEVFLLTVLRHVISSRLWRSRPPRSAHFAFWE